MAQVDHPVWPTRFAGSRWTPWRRRNPAIPACRWAAPIIATVLFTQFLKYDAAEPDWPDRDRFVLSAGHGSMLLYSLLYLTGNPEMTLDQIKHFRQVDSLTPGHPENFRTKGVETTTGPLGQGIATAVGMALAEKMLAAEFGKKIVDHHTYVLCSDGDLMEGVSQEAIALAGHWRLNKMIVLYDDNGISIDGPTSLSDSVDQVKRFKSAGWAAELIDGQDQEAVAAAITRAQKSGKPSLIACKTTIGYGAPHKAGTNKAHGEALGADELKGAKEKLGISLEPFSVPDDVLKAWREAGSRGAAARKEWEARFAELGPRKRAEFERRLRHERPASLAKALRDHKKKLLETPLNVATRKSSEAAIDVIAAAMPMEFLAGSADLTGSTNNKAKIGDRVRGQDAEGPLHPLRHPRARHGGVPERHLPAWRLCAERRDVPGVHRLRAAGDAACGADGHRRDLRHDARFHRPRRRRPDAPAGRASLRAARHPQHAGVPALRRDRGRRVLGAGAEPHHGPTVLALTRQNLPQLRTNAPADNPCSHGAYELVGGQGEAKVSLFASGSEVEIAVAAQKQLAERGIASRVVSVPSLELLLSLPEDRQKAIIGNAPVKVAIEAAVRWGWDAVIGHDGMFIGMHWVSAKAARPRTFSSTSALPPRPRLTQF